MTERKSRMQSGQSYVEPTPSQVQRIPRNSPTVASVGMIAADPVSLVLTVVNSLLNFGTAYLELQAEKEVTHRLEMQIVAEQERHQNRMTELRAEFLMLERQIHAEEDRRHAIESKLAFIRSEVERCRTQLDQALADQGNLTIIKVLQENYLQLTRSYTELSLKLAGG